MFVFRTPPSAGSSTGGFSAGAWRVGNVNAELLTTKAGVFASYRWYLTDSLSGGAATVGLRRQTPGAPVAGDWDNLP